MLIDEVTIHVFAGDGGRGCAAFDKNLNSRGPTGGSGGRGGSIYFEGTSDLNALSQFRNRKKIKAQDGQAGRSQFRDGANSPDLTVSIPLGTVIHQGEKAILGEMTRVGQRILIAHGGRGGRGNFLFRSSTNTTPQEFEDGQTGQRLILNLEMKMIADVGLVGLPNVGKSSLLNELTRAKSKVGNYTFTTLEPHLGNYNGLIIADLPGLIEDASKGRGLGHKFLKHIERTRIIFHLVSCDSADPLRDYKIVRQELANFNRAILAKPEYLFLSKSDNIESESKKKILALFQKEGILAYLLSVHDLESLNKVKEILNGLINRNL